MANRYPVLLAIDTTTEICSVAIQTPLGDMIHAEHSQSTHHAQAILPLIEKLLNQAKLILADIEFIAVSVGPGSFTGVRAGIATAQGLAYGLGIKVIPMGTLDLIALGLPQEGQVQVISDARMQQFYVGGFEWQEGRLATIQAPCLLSETELWGVFVSTVS
jgi:tRNA threonylcarbamoyladenosine biosynthesis protein TsaB